EREFCRVAFAAWSEPKKRPGALWLLFYGRRRRGFPWLLAGVLAAIVLFALVFAIPGGAGVSRAVPGGADGSAAVAGALFGPLLAGALVFAIVAVLRPRRRR